MTHRLKLTITTYREKVFADGSGDKGGTMIKDLDLNGVPSSGICASDGIITVPGWPKP